MGRMEKFLKHWFMEGCFDKFVILLQIPKNEKLFISNIIYYVFKLNAVIDDLLN
jgi:hypothetical protein